MRDSMSSGSGTSARGMSEKNRMLITTTMRTKVVPHRVWAVLNRSTDSGSRGASASWALIALCSAPW